VLKGDSLDSPTMTPSSARSSPFTATRSSSTRATRAQVVSGTRFVITKVCLKAEIVLFQRLRRCCGLFWQSFMTHEKLITCFTWFWKLQSVLKIRRFLEDMAFLFTFSFSNSTLYVAAPRLYDKDHTIQSAHVKPWWWYEKNINKIYFSYTINRRTKSLHSHNRNVHFSHLNAQVCRILNDDNTSGKKKNGDCQVWVRIWCYSK
jgi:hypothetical protein